VLQHVDAKAGAAVITEGRNGECACTFPAAHGGLVGVSALPLRPGEWSRQQFLSGAI